MRKLAVGLIISMGVAGCSGGQAPSASATPPPAAASANSISGTYVSFGHDAKSDQVFVEALRITQTGNQFAGTLESTKINQAGHSTSSSQNVTGSIDGSHATVALDQGLGHTNRNATIEAGAITLSWMQDGQLATERFVTKTDAEYGAMLDKLKGAANQLNAEVVSQVNAKKADEQASELTQRIQRFLDVEPKWTMTVVETRHDKAEAYGKAGVARVQQLMATHNAVAEGQANALVGQMIAAQAQLNLAIDNTEREILGARSKLADIDIAVEASPCVNRTGELKPGAPASCGALAQVVPKYWQVRMNAEDLQRRMEHMDEDTKQAFEQRLAQAQQVVNARNN